MPFTETVIIPLWDGVDTASLVGERTFESVPEEIALKLISGTLRMGLAGLWHMNSDWTDKSGNGNTGTPAGDAAFDTVNKKLGSACGTFDGTGDYVTIGDVAALKITGAFTMLAWIKTGAAAGIIYSKYGGSNNPTSPYIRVNASGYVEFYVDSGGPTWTYRTSSVTVNNNAWHHVVCIFDPSTSMDIYIDNLLRNGSLSNGPVQSAMTDTTAAAVIGSDGTGGTPFNGLIDELAIWDRTLATTEISTLYNGGTGAEIADTDYDAASPSPAQQWEGLPANSVVDMSTIRIPENMNAGDAGTVKYRYAVNGGALNGVWLTQAALRLESAPTISDATQSIKVVPQYISDGEQKTTSQAFALVNVQLPGGGPSGGGVITGITPRVVRNVQTVKAVKT